MPDFSQYDTNLKQIKRLIFFIMQQVFHDFRLMLFIIAFNRDAEIFKVCQKCYSIQNPAVIPTNEEC